MDDAIKEVKVVRFRDKVNVFNHATKKMTEMRVLDAVRHVLLDTKAQYMLGNKDVNVMVKLSTDGTLCGVILEPKRVSASPSSSSNTVYCDCDSKKLPSASDHRRSNKFESELEQKPSKSGTVFNDKIKGKVYKCDNSREDTDVWWKNKSEDEEDEEEDLDLTLDWDNDNDMLELEETIFPEDVLEATQLPPERISGILQKRKEATDKKEAKVESCTVETEEQEHKKHAWKDCWNCKAPSPPVGIYSDNPNNLRVLFCCDKSREAYRVKPTNTEIKRGPKMYPYDSWVNHGIE